jgi:hypothetical protein
MIYNYRGDGYAKYTSKGKGKIKLLEGTTISKEVQDIENELFPKKKRKRKNHKTKIRAILNKFKHPNEPKHS